MTTINFIQKKREKEWKFERSVLRELSIKQLKISVTTAFRLKGPIYILKKLRALEESTIDCAIEAYLLGASYSNYYLSGATLEVIKDKSKDQMEQIIFILRQYVDFYFSKHQLPMAEAVLQQCEEVIWFWWQEGFKTGVKRKKLRM